MLFTKKRRHQPVERCLYPSSEINNEHTLCKKHRAQRENIKNQKTINPKCKCGNTPIHNKDDSDANEAEGIGCHSWKYDGYIKEFIENYVRADVSLHTGK